MKRILFFICIGSLALAMPAMSAPNKQGGRSKKAPSAQAVSKKGGGHAVRHAAPARTARNVSAARVHPTRKANHVNTAKVHNRNNVAVNRQRNINHANTVNRANTVRNNRDVAARNARANAAIARNNAAVNRDRNINNANALQNSRAEAARAARDNARVGPINRQANLNAATNLAAAERARNARIVNNWRSENFSGQNYTAFRDYRRQWHDRDWWHNHYTRIILVGGGWWAWNAGYWYPAWGYDPYYRYYPYDGPIYGYGDLTPDQVIINVQTRLQNDGYYVGSIDGVLGPQTRRAIAAYQADHGLAVTSAVDEPTLETLGLT